METAHNQF